MSERDAHDPALLRSYEGLVFTTAAMLSRQLRGHETPDDDLDDLMQLLRMKVFRALQLYSPVKVRRKRGESHGEARDRYVFMCVYDMAKDIAKRKRVLVLMIEDEAPASAGREHDGGPRDSFDARYLAQSQEETYSRVEDELPLIPNTISETERRVLALLYLDFTHREIAARLGITKGEVESAVRALRRKLADWRPPAAANDETGATEAAPVSRVT